MKSKRSGWGFTFIELITVLILIGIVSAVAVTRITSTAGFAEYTYQNRLISSLRNMQQRAMHDNRTGFCYRVNMVSGADSPAFGPPSLNFAADNQASTCDGGIDLSTDFLATTAIEMAAENLVLDATDSGISSLAYIGFDGLGRPLTNLSNCINGCQVSITGIQRASVCVEAQGYVHAC